jgi:hypothetical protein
MKRLLVASALVVAVLVAAVAIGQLWPRNRVEPTFVSYPIAGLAPCADSCPKYVAEAERWLDATVPTHVGIVSSAVYRPGGGVLLDGDGGRRYIVELTLADGSRVQAKVQCGIGVQPDQCGTFEFP